MSMEKKASSCPICGKYFSNYALTKHVNSCLDKQEFDPDFDPTINNDNEENQELEPPGKRIKLLAPDQSDSDKSAYPSHISTLTEPENTNMNRKRKISETFGANEVDEANSNLSGGNTINSCQTKEMANPDNYSGTPAYENFSPDRYNRLKIQSLNNNIASSKTFSWKKSPDLHKLKKNSDSENTRKEDTMLSPVKRTFTWKTSTENEESNVTSPLNIKSNETKSSTSQKSIGTFFKQKPGCKATGIGCNVQTSVHNSNAKISSPPKKQVLSDVKSHKSLLGQINANKPDVDTVLDNGVPLAEQMRPMDFSGYFGQNNTVGRGKLLRELLEGDQVPSMILWGPPGCGKTTLAKIIARRSKTTHNTRFTQLSATTAGVSDVKEMVKVAKNDLKMLKRRTILFVDEIHRFNKLQQDSFLPHVEDGTITLIGATTENPSFQVNNALMSRCKVVVLDKLEKDCLKEILQNALQRLHVNISENNNTSTTICIHPDALSCLANFCDGDARGALNCLEVVVRSKRGQLNPVVPGASNQTNKAATIITVENIKEALQRSHIQYDRAGDEHYHCASALQKSIRGSNDNGAIYWMTRMFEGGEDPLFIARRLLVCASEDIGMADPQALPLAMATFQACQVIGKPECAINLAHCTTYLARAPKSFESTAALGAARRCIKEHEGPLPGVPLHLRNASSKLGKQLGYGKGYKWSHGYSNEDGQQDYLPKELLHKDFYERRKDTT